MCKNISKQIGAQIKDPWELDIVFKTKLVQLYHFPQPNKKMHQTLTFEECNLTSLSKFDTLKNIFISSEKLPERPGKVRIFDNDDNLVIDLIKFSND